MIKRLRIKIQKEICNYLWNNKPWLVMKYIKLLDWTK